MRSRPVNHPFAGLVIRSVLFCYAIWGSVVVYDLVLCENKRSGQCEPQRSELRNVATSIPATLLAWLADSPVTGREGQARTSSARTTASRRES